MRTPLIAEYNGARLIVIGKIFFPELFGKDVNGYKPFYSDEFEFRKFAEKQRIKRKLRQ
ncbi:hypothetical protein KEJ19_04025 [Candidatus Bathyarchaeota archaeon]|nr:hypothetical protein [Candidatus Bathyarchaeota archaeon]